MIDVIQRQDVTILRMDHGKANALDVELCQGITARLEMLRTSSSVAVILIGTGNIFSAGVDLLRVLDEGIEYLQTFLSALTMLYETVFFYPKPVAAAVNGHAIAGGCVLACAADHRVMVREAGRIGVTELLVGLPFPPMAMEIMRFTTVPQHLQALIYSGTTFSPQEAINLGLIDEMAEPHDLVDRAVAAAERLLSVPAPTFELTKRQIRQPVWERLQASRPGFERAVQAVWTKPETREVIRAYVSRTFKKPRS